ncbi:MAG: hypothetical protein QW255_04785, partial [Candidatus Bilamarchaeaceae archaeon]
LYSVISGGSNNVNNGNYSTILGGYNNQIYSGSNYVLLFGNGVQLNTAVSNRVYFFNENDYGYLLLNTTNLPSGYIIAVGSNSNNGNGAGLTAGGSWQNASSISFKDDLTELDKDELLEGLKKVSIARWRYKGTNEYHIGPTSEEFIDLYKVGILDDGENSKKYLSSYDVAGVALGCVKVLLEKIESLEKEIQTMKNLSITSE